MFERPHHQRIAHVLAALNGDLLRQHGCLFGGGTCIALRHGEYRESVDIDFLVSDAAGYRELRQLVTGAAGLNALLRPGAQPLTVGREVRADQYGLRTQVRMDGQLIKLEIVREARMALEAPGKTDVVCGIATLTMLDLAASKLLANSAAQADDGAFSRDVIDLATSLEIVTKRGAFFSYGDIRLGQGRENSKEFLRQNQEISLEIEEAVRQRAMGGDVPLALASGGGEDGLSEDEE